jgi:hypothetical protein
MGSDMHHWALHHDMIGETPPQDLKVVRRLGAGKAMEKVISYLENIEPSDYTNTNSLKILLAQVVESMKLNIKNFTDVE